MTIPEQTEMRPRILLTNDDGYMASGLSALFEALSTMADVTVVAPDRERSAVAMAITLTDPLRAWPIKHNGLNGFFVNGTPADCVKIGYGVLMGDNKPDFVFSGINQGSNVGLNANYSGTVAGAVEGAMCGVPSVAVSLCSYSSRDFSGACRAALAVLHHLLENPLPKYELLSVNVPPLPVEELKGLRMTRASMSVFREVFDRRIDARNREYFWMGGTWADFEPSPDGDHALTRDGWATVTPFKVNWTAENTLESFRQNGWDENWLGNNG